MKTRKIKIDPTPEFIEFLQLAEKLKKSFKKINIALTPLEFAPMGVVIEEEHITRNGD